MWNLVMKSFEEYNAIVLAYGRIDSRKAYTISTPSVGVADFALGALLRVTCVLFHDIQKRKNEVDFIIKA
jgi:hypothetical protein